METPTPVSSSVMTPGPSPSSSNILTMNDFTLDMTPGPDSLLVPQSSAAKQPKKRKSWGQALPEPKTNLPPRKRAKTDDEKEQRRIERIKRNRAAAHNSRERKRQEAERLEIENNKLKQQMLLMQQQLLRQNARLAEFQRLAPGVLPQLSSDDFAVSNMTFDLSDIKDECSADTPASLDTIDPRASFSSATPCDMSTPFIKAESPSAPTSIPTPSASATGAALDATRHSAAMLCDLQCQSSRLPLMVTVTRWWAQTILYMMHLNIMTCYKTLLAACWTLWPARMAHILEMTPISTTFSTTCSTRTSSRTTRTTTRPRPMQSAPLPTSTTPFSLQSFLSLLLLSQTSAQSFLATGLPREAASAATSLALLSKLGERRRVLLVKRDGNGVGSLHHQRSRRFRRYSKEDPDRSRNR